MATTKAFAGSGLKAGTAEEPARAELERSIARLTRWLDRNRYRGYDPFDGLSSPLLRPLTFESRLLRTVLQQGVRRLPLNLRPLLGIRRSLSTKGMGFLGRGFIRMNQATGDQRWNERARDVFEWLIDHQAGEYHGASWGNHFDYQSRGFYLPRGVPTVVWTSLIGHAFLDAYCHLHEERYLKIAVDACEHILRDLKTHPHGEGTCINYIPGGSRCEVHNANVLGGSLLARTGSFISNPGYRELARRSMQYTVEYQHPDGGWWYGERGDMHWIDNFHTAYVLDCLKYYADSTGDERFNRHAARGYEYWKRTFFLEDGTPRYYDRKTYPLDIQCCSQAIDTLVFYADRDRGALALAVKVARWTIRRMQGRSGSFYYRRYAGGITNRTPTLHWGQATMLSALSGLYKQLSGDRATA